MLRRRIMAFPIVNADVSVGFGSGTLRCENQYGIGRYDHLPGSPLSCYQRREFIGTNLLGERISTACVRRNISSNRPGRSI